MKRVLILVFTALLLVSCGQNGINDIEEQEVIDKVLAVNDSFETKENTPLVLPDFLSNDTYKSGNVKVTFDANSVKNGTITLSGNKYTYTPQTDFLGTDSFTYTICSTITTTSCDTATVSIVVKAGGSNSGGNGSFNIPTELVAYYNGVDFTLTGASLKDELATKTSSTHTTTLSYTPGVWDALKQSDLDPTDNTKVLLIYGYSDTDGNYVTDRSRDKNETGGTQGSDWNREHVYPKSLGNPNLGQSGPGADAHHLRPCDVRFNSNRGSKKICGRFRYCW
jgi:endonuclease I